MRCHCLHGQKDWNGGSELIAWNWRSELKKHFTLSRPVTACEFSFSHSSPQHDGSVSGAVSVDRILTCQTVQQVEKHNNMLQRISTGTSSETPSLRNCCRYIASKGFETGGATYKRTLAGKLLKALLLKETTGLLYRYLLINQPVDR